MSIRRIFRFLPFSILVAAIIGGALSLSAVCLLGYRLTYVGLAVVVLIGLVGTGLFVLLGESLIEDLVKAALMLGLTGALWALDGRGKFIFVATAVMVATGILANHLFKKLQKFDGEGA